MWHTYHASAIVADPVEVDMEHTTKSIPPVEVVEKNPDRVVGYIILWLFALLGFFDLVTGGVLWQ